MPTKREGAQLLSSLGKKVRKLTALEAVVEARKRFLEPRPVLRRKVRHITLPKFKVGTLSKVETIMYDVKGRPAIAMRMQRRKPQMVQMAVSQLRKNPDKIIVDSIKLGSWPLQVCYYVNAPFHFLICLGPDYVRLPTELCDWLIRALKKVPRGQ
jgi:hypothetical protein